MFFGLKGTPATFATMINVALGHLALFQLVLYINGRSVYHSDKFKGAARVCLHSSPSAWSPDEFSQMPILYAGAVVTFCGFRISINVFSPDVQKIEAVMGMPPTLRSQSTFGSYGLVPSFYSSVWH